MGSVAKVFKKAKKVVKKPLSKITKGIARGIAKVGKSVMKGVAKLNKKLGPIGMIGLSIAMPYAMSAEEAQKRIIAGTLDASQLGGQTLGTETAGWFTKGQTSAQISANDLVTETINNGLKDQINMLDGTAKRVFNDHVAHQKAMGSFVNYEAPLDATMNSQGVGRNFATDFSTEPTSYSMDLSKNKDYKYVASGHPTESGTYQFTGGDTYNNSIGKSSIKKASNLKKNAKYAAGTMAKSLISQDSAYKLPEVMYASTADMTQTTTGGYGGTEIEGSWGGSLLQGAFSDDHRERIMNFYKNMNIVGSH